MRVICHTWVTFYFWIVTIFFLVEVWWFMHKSYTELLYVLFFWFMIMNIPFSCIHNFLAIACLLTTWRYVSFPFECKFIDVHTLYIDPHTHNLSQKLVNRAKKRFIIFIIIGPLLFMNHDINHSCYFNFMFIPHTLGK